MSCGRRLAAIPLPSQGTLSMLASDCRAGLENFLNYQSARALIKKQAIKDLQERFANERGMSTCSKCAAARRGLWCQILTAV